MTDSQGFFPCGSLNLRLIHFHARSPIRQGEIFTKDNVACRRPAAGRSPMLYWDVLGTTAARDYGSEEALD